MAVVERCIQSIPGGKWDEFMEWENKWVPVNKRLGMPPKRHYRAFYASHDICTHVWEIEWASLAELEATWAKMLADPEAQALVAQHFTFVAREQRELYFLLP